MYEYDYGGDATSTHKMPTMRLINQKNASVTHKSVFKEGIEMKREYSIGYTPGPEKSYIIEPHGGKINYKLAEKNPLKFYDQVMNQDITMHKVKESPSPSPTRKSKFIT